MTFQDLRSGRCSTTCTPTTSKARENFQSCKHIASLQLIIVDGTSHLHRYFIKLNSLNFSAKQSKLDTMKASVPKLFDCPGSGFASPFRDVRPAVSRPPLKLTTSWDLSPNLVSTLRTLQAFALPVPRLRLGVLLPRAVQNHNPLLTPNATPN